VGLYEKKIVINVKHVFLVFVLLQYVLKAVDGWEGATYVMLMTLHL